MHKNGQKLLFLQLLVLRTWHGVDCINFTRIIELSDQIRQKEEIRSMVVFSQESFVSKLTGFEELLKHESSIVPLVLIGEDYNQKKQLGQILGTWSSVLVFMDNVDNHKMFSIINETLRHIHSTKMLFALESFPSNESLTRFFKACLRLGIVNIIVMTNDQVLTYEPFPKVSVENITSSSVSNYYPDRSYDLKGYVFFTPIQQDGSRVFLYTDKKDGSIKFTGTNVEIFRSFVNRHNATVERLVEGTNHSGFDILGGLALLTQGKVDILVHSYSSFAPNLFAYSYPIAQVEWLLAFPYVGEISPYKYLILPFDHEVWISLGVSFVYISIASFITRRYCQNLNEYGPAFSRSFTQFIYLPSTSLSCNLRSLIFEMQIFCYGLILTNIYLAFLSAFLTTTVQGKQIETLEDLHNNGFQILSTYFEKLVLTNTSGYDHRYDNIYKLAEIDFINEYRKSLNKTYAFALAEDRANFFLGQQKYLEKKRMHVSKTTLGTYLLTFIMQNDSPFRKNFDNILLQLYETGLYKKWDEDVFNKAVTEKYLQIYRPESEDIFKPMTMSHLGVAWASFAIGIGFSIGVFLVEHIRFRGGKTPRRRR